MLDANMPLTHRQKQLVILSFARIIPISSRFSKMFYERLWELAPETQFIFAKTDMDEQREKLFKAISTAITSLDNMEKFIPVIHRLGETHRRYGIKKEHYEYMGQALLWTLEHELGQEFTPELKEAWGFVYVLIADIARQYQEVHS